MYCLVVQSRFLHIHQFNVSLINLGRRERGGRLEELLAFRQATAIVRERHAHGQSLFLSGGGRGMAGRSSLGARCYLPACVFRQLWGRVGGREEKCGLRIRAIVLRVCDCLTLYVCMYYLIRLTV